MNREHIAWREDNGTYSVGFYRFEYTGNTEDEDFDPEWDVCYDYNEFHYMLTGLLNLNSITGPYGNPGYLDYTEDPEEVATAKALAEKFRKR